MRANDICYRQNNSTIDRNIWIGNHQVQANWFAFDVINRNKIPWTRYSYVMSWPSFVLKSEQLNMNVHSCVELSNLTASLKGLFRFDDVRTSWDCLRGQLCTAAELPNHIHLYKWTSQTECRQNMMHDAVISWFRYYLRAPSLVW